MRLCIRSDRDFSPHDYVEASSIALRQTFAGIGRGLLLIESATLRYLVIGSTHSSQLAERWLGSGVMFEWNWNPW